MKLEGIVTNIRYRNDESGYSVMTLDTTDSDITIVGTMPFLMRVIGLKLLAI